MNTGIKMVIANLNPHVFWIDLFAGAGGTTTGIHLAGINAKVVACVNHDAIAISSHQANHPDCDHFTEDVRDFQVVLKLKNIVDDLRRRYPGCIINLWASLECTNYSKAKGGLPRDADSRTLPQTLHMRWNPEKNKFYKGDSYIQMLDPDNIYIENVREFMAWGPMDKNGKPISMKKGIDYLKWRDSIMKIGYKFDYKLMNSANYGSCQKRIRYFGIFTRKNFPLVFPPPTHEEKKTNTDLFRKPLKKWRAVREVLDLEDKGSSIFNRKKPLVENSLKRIYAGLVKFVANGEDIFCYRSNGGADGLWRRVSSIEKPFGVVTTKNNTSLIRIDKDKKFCVKHYSGKPHQKVYSLDKTSGTITCSGNQSIASVEFITTFNGNSVMKGMNDTCPVVSTKDRLQLNFIVLDYNKSKVADVNNPSNTITANPKLNLVDVDLNNKTWINDAQYDRKGITPKDPMFTLIARMDKTPPYIFNTESGKRVIVIEKEDTDTMIKIKIFMALYGIKDIKMRMFRIPELKAIQGFPVDYILKGNQTQQKKQIGNAVDTAASKALAMSNYNQAKFIVKTGIKTR